MRTKIYFWLAPNLIQISQLLAQFLFIGAVTWAAPSFRVGLLRTWSPWSLRRKEREGQPRNDIYHLAHSPLSGTAHTAVSKRGSKLKAMDIG